LEHIRNDKNEPTLSQEQKIPRLAPELEARHKLINKLLKETHINQVLELAAGLSTRGLIMTQNSDIKYSELDLSPMAQLKKEIVGKIKKIPQNLNIVAGNALRLADLKKATSSFDSNKPLAIINEGLLRYLSFPEKAQVARNVHVLLKKFGGVWLTCDVAPKNFLATQDSVTKPGLNKELKNMSGKNFENNMFENQEHFTNFFADLGFSVEVHALSEIEGELTSPGQLAIYGW
jgi:O-methyltransferase involved in polyketide biosynthesis